MSRERSLRHPVTYVFLALVSFLLVSGWIRSSVTWPEAFDVRAKIQAFVETRDEYDAIYLGSSRVFRAFRPDVIDPVLSAGGEPFRSYNLGIPGMWSFESDHLLDEILALEPARLSWVFVETPLWKADLFSNLRKITERSVRWHTPSRTARVLQSIWLEEHALDARVSVSWRHLRQAAMRFSNYSLGPTWWSSTFGPESPDFAASVRAYRDSRGYKPLETFDVPGTRKRRQTFLRDQDIYLDGVRALTAAQESGVEIPGGGLAISMPGQTEAAGNSLAFHAYNVDALRAQRERIEARDLNLAYFTLPELAPGHLPADLQQRGELTVLLDYKRPARYPAFYTIEDRFDFWHMSEQGAERFSRKFAQDARTVMAQN